jgi:hypothetical protein
MNLYDASPEDKGEAILRLNKLAPGSVLSAPDAAAVRTVINELGRLGSLVVVMSAVRKAQELERKLDAMLN